MSKALAPSNVVLTARDPKGQKFMDIVEGAYNKARLSSEEGQRINDTPGLADLIGQFITKHRIPNLYADEEVKSVHGYYSGYKAPKGLIEQVNILRELFSGLGFANHEYQVQIEKAEIKLPEGAEGWSAIPNPFKNEKIFGVTYNKKVGTILGKIKQAKNGKFCNGCRCWIDEKRLRMSPRTEKFFHDHANAQGDPDILIIPTQFGIRHRGRSVRRASTVFTLDEFGLGSFAVGCMLLISEDRLNNNNDLWIDCVGDEFDDPDSSFRFGHVPFFTFDNGKVGFSTGSVDFASDNCGSASGFLPQ